MTRRAFISVIFVVVSSAAVRGAAIPESKRLESRILLTISAPADNTMKLPTDVAVDQQGRVCVADGVNDRVVCFAPDGQFDRSFSHIGNEPLSNPIALTFDASGQLWIADNGNHRIVVASPLGKLIEVIALPDDNTGKRADPTGIALGPKGARTYIVDNDHHRLLIRDNTSGAFTTLGEKGRSLSQFEWPFMVDVGSNGTVRISETIGARVQCLDAQNRWTQSISGWGVELGKLYRPKGIAIDAKGRIFVSDSTLGVVQVFGPFGKTIGVLTDETGQILRFEHPMGICFDSRGRLLVVETRKNRVAVVEIGADGRGRP
ncbi:MAG: hypothetical protein GXP29_14420 [Planctomycetes bacterium]|nr:hypothetical protein [Planctomycetota bacterium]